jgi:hypothetical protein
VKAKMALWKNDFPRFQSANAVSPKDVAPLVTLARSAPVTGGGCSLATE